MGARNGYVVRAGYRPRRGDDIRFQREAIHKSGAVVLIHLPGEADESGWAILMQRENHRFMHPVHLFVVL